MEFYSRQKAGGRDPEERELHLSSLPRMSSRTRWRRSQTRRGTGSTRIAYARERYPNQDTPAAPRRVQEIFCSHAVSHEEFVQRYAERVRQASAAPAGKGPYVPGSEVEGD